MNILKSWQLLEQWARGVERALEETPRTPESAPKRLEQTAGLTVKAHIRSGGVSIPGCGAHSIRI